MIRILVYRKRFDQMSRRFHSASSAASEHFFRCERCRYNIMCFEKRDGQKRDLIYGFYFFRCYIYPCTKRTIHLIIIELKLKKGKGILLKFKIRIGMKRGFRNHSVIFFAKVQKNRVEILTTELIEFFIKSL